MSQIQTFSILFDLSYVYVYTHLCAHMAQTHTTHIYQAHTKLLSKEPALLSGNHPFFLHVTLVPHQDNLRIVPGVGLDLSSPGERWRDDNVNDTLQGGKGP